MNEVNRKLNIPNEWAKAQEACRAAQVLLREHFPADAISRAYYAAFHAGKALLLSDGLEVKSHEGLGRLFSLHFVKSGRFDVRFSRILSKSQKHREEADYSAEYVFTEEDARCRLQEVSEFLQAAEAFLKKAGYL